MISNQANLFLIFIAEGAIIGLIFDVFRILRKSFKTSDLLTYLEDIIFWIMTGILILYSIFVFNYGEIRFFMFIGILIGATIYMLSISKYVIKVSVTIINILKKILNFIFFIISTPFKIIYKISKKIFEKPILFCIINIRKIIRQINIKNSKNNRIKFKFLSKNAKSVKK